MKTEELKKLNIRLFSAMLELETNWDGLANYLGVTRTFITAVRNGKRNMGSEPLKKLEKLEKETGLCFNRNNIVREELPRYNSSNDNALMAEQLRQAQEREKQLMEIIRNLSRNGASK